MHRIKYAIGNNQDRVTCLGYIACCNIIIGCNLMNELDALFLSSQDTQKLNAVAPNSEII